MNRIRTLAYLALLGGAMVLPACTTTLGQLRCGSGQIAKFDGQHWHCAADETGTPAGPDRGLVWLNHHDLVLPDFARFRLTSNGTTVFVKNAGNGPFPDWHLLSLFVPTLPPGHRVTGIRVCYGIIGDHPATGIHRLRLAQFDPASGRDEHWPGYVIRLEDGNPDQQAPDPSPGGLAYDDPAGFVCVDSTPGQWQPCLEPAHGTIAAGIGVRLGDADDRIGIQAVGVHYATDCPP